MSTLTVSGSFFCAEHNEKLEQKRKKDAKIFFIAVWISGLEIILNETGRYPFCTIVV
jgi:hypothetical protein